MLRPYRLTDQQPLVDLLRLNTPLYFAPSEELAYIDYLNLHAEAYFVVETDNGIIGAGGINYGFDNGRTARLSWDIVHPHHHGKGIGAMLTRYRIDEITKNANVDSIVVRTTQLVFGFYQKMGFRLCSIEKDFWAEGFDLYVMRMEY